jgi:hypothetical protein
VTAPHPEIPGDPQPGSIAAGARAVILIADFANVDAGGKLNLLGAGWQVVRRAAPSPGAPPALPPHSVVVIIDIPPAHVGEQFAMTLILNDAHGEPVTIENPILGEPQALRIQQLVTVQAAPVPGVPPGEVAGRVQAVIGLQALVVDPGIPYTWTLEIDGHRSYHWQAVFFVAREEVPPVFG